ncbi:IS1 family transposase [Paludibacter sp. 221]|uniref:IS1/IS1595 family N-terminal zinc-binding domain-containing protein n=1 Tax=Paludibacter sp. 221 TaxID=2302939 RepID=UPI0013D6E4C6|nr:IS1 family transposase [Paludibacter sp. 221]NDV46706.1 IS1 family transposase [Paludibacter sp. 221]
MSCPKCKSNDKVKNGLIKGVQRYLCKQCGCNYTVSSKFLSEKEAKHQLAFSLYSEGHSFHAISRILGVSHVSVMNWVRKRESDVMIFLFIFSHYYLSLKLFF